MYSKLITVTQLQYNIACCYIKHVDKLSRLEVICKISFIVTQTFKLIKDKGFWKIKETTLNNKSQTFKFVKIRIIPKLVPLPLFILVFVHSKIVMVFNISYKVTVYKKQRQLCSYLQ